MHTLHVELGERSYPIYIGRDLLNDPQLLGAHLTGSQVVVVTNETVSPLYLDRLLAILGERALVTEVILPDGEQFKNLETLNQIFDRMMHDRHNRSTTMIALGGGVVGDITGFAAACYQRGVNFIQVPTTLLSQVDSSVGGKTAVNHPLGKNMIGAFYQPQAVLIDINTLHTLSPREFAAGLAEVVKYGLICDLPFYRWLQEQTPRLLAREEAALAEAIERSCSSKAAVVAADEREGALRAILNLGHTFGHAIETAQGYGKWLHGEAVAVGMLMAMELSARRGWIEPAEVVAFRDLLRVINLPVAPPADMTPGQYLDLMGRDKKVIDGRLRLVLLRGMGEACIVDDATEEELVSLLETFR
ncbi:3-dehydroquinate synthase [Halieaceae bacterium IMCC8485]|jgi:3-dehydroquinate synthase|uniref:3-dehydroquinate synthase n=1 Tax=Candidatus Seongchinamella marina TaxID=2518990 RepID=A0ABT3SV75_9GAMM|nr:3-dehydroquinate synthase [Candidatus Seongchinamella marina]MCX2973884.1 3-dehydroquinate synthase [Candidatus Seongchinamella marina]